jgi:hypothetical protein
VPGLAGVVASRAKAPLPTARSMTKPVSSAALSVALS